MFDDSMGGDVEVELEAASSSEDESMDEGK